MKRFAGVFGALVVALGVAVPIGLSDDGGGGEGPTKAPAVTCARTVFAAAILRVGDDALWVRPGDSETARPIIVRLDRETVVKKGDAVAGRSALVAGKRARFLVRVCRSGERKLITARVITLAGDPPAATAPPRTEPGPEPSPTPTPEVCGQGELNTVLVAVSSASITVRTTSSEGTKEWPIAITGDTVVRKNDVNVSISALKAGDLVHVVLVRCPSGSVRALRIVFISAAPTT
jgi:hypothetical protein